MPLKFHPEPGTILFCNYAGFKVPEMVKRRPVIVVSPRFRHPRPPLCSVVPLSTTRPNPARAYHCKIVIDPPLPDRWSTPQCWVKADMVATVVFWRLDLIKIGKDASGKRMYRTIILDHEQMTLVRECVKAALNLG